MCIYCGNLEAKHNSEDFKFESGTLGTNQDIATYLSEGFWRDSGVSSNVFNLSNVGALEDNPKNNLVTYNTISNNYDANGLSEERASLVDEAFKYIESILGIDFQETTDSEADIRFGDFENNSAFAQAFGTSGNTKYVNIQISSDWNSSKSGFGNYTFQTILHEIGHGLGLGHAGNYNVSGSFESDAKFENDSWQTSVMSYWSQEENKSISATFAYTSSFMTADIIALDDTYAVHGYGSSRAFNEDTIYGFNTNIDGSTSAILNEMSTWISSTTYTIVDGSGTDTLDFNGFSDHQKIDLRASEKNSSNLFASNIAGNIGNLVIAPGSIIENAIGGSGDDELTGNSSNNTLNGGIGQDTMIGGEGDDTLIGGEGSDTASYSTSGSAVSINLLFSTFSGGDADGDTLTSIENIIGSGFADLIIGDSKNNTLTGNGGNDTIDGGGGSDTVVFNGNVADYNFSLNSTTGSIQILDSDSTRDGSDAVIKIESFKFNDQTYSLSDVLAQTSFDILDYIASHSDLISTFGINTSAAFDHYVSNGQSEGRTPDNFDEWSYLASNEDLLTAFGNDVVTGLKHYVNNGYSEGRSKDSFDEWSYLASNGDLITAFGNNTGAATQHYVNNGYSEGRSKDSFDEWSYLASNGDLIIAFGNNTGAATQHYVNNGFAEGRSLDSFDEWSYLAGNGDLLTAFGNDTITGTKHYINHGYAEGRSLDSFDELSYIAGYGDLINAFKNDTSSAPQHYVNNGYSEGRSADNFDEWGYMASNTDLIRAFGSDTSSAVEHYINNGFAEGRSLDSFDASNYLSLNGDLQTAFGSDLNAATQHYVLHGFNEGRAI